MNSKLRHFKYYFVAALAVISISITAFEWLYDIPMKKCEAAKNWWSWRYRECSKPIYLPTLTGRPAGDKGQKAVDIDWHEKSAAPAAEPNAQADASQ